MADDSNADFFEEATPASRVKATIVTHYFAAWANVIKSRVADWGVSGAQKFGYVDLYCGPGQYEDGTASTPLLILDHILSDPILSQHIKLHFNDADPERTTALRRNILLHAPDYSKIAERVSFSNDNVSTAMSARLTAFSNFPTLYFIDPFGVKGLTLDLLKAVIKRRGSDCIFLLNYKKVNWHLASAHYRTHIDALFGRSRADKLRELVATSARPIAPEKREELIVAEIRDALVALGAEPAEPFKFLDSEGARTSHFLFLAVKHPKGEEIWKRLATQHSTYTSQGVPSFVFTPKPDESKNESIQPLLSNLGIGPLDQLKRDLPRRFAGRRMVVQDIVADVGKGTKFAGRDIKRAILELSQSPNSPLTLDNLGPGTHLSDTRVALSDDAVVIFK